MEKEKGKSEDADECIGNVEPDDILNATFREVDDSFLSAKSPSVCNTPQSKQILTENESPELNDHNSMKLNTPNPT